jgi:ribosomal protein S18 acetylase RimI-like enzyme
MAATDVSLRPAQAEDVDFLSSVYAATRSEELALTDWSDAQKSAFCRQQFEAQDSHYRTHYPTAEYLVITSGTESIGRLYVDRWEKEIRVMDIAILPPYRGLGIGTQLLRKLQDEARAVGKPLSIHVEKFNPALRLYERLGFRSAEDRGIYLLLKWTP